MIRTENKKARFLHQDSRAYRGQRGVNDYKTRARRIERRAARQRLHLLATNADR